MGTAVGLPGDRNSRTFFCSARLYYFQCIMMQHPSFGATLWSRAAACLMGLSQGYFDVCVTILMSAGKRAASGPDLLKMPRGLACDLPLQPLANPVPPCRPLVGLIWVNAPGLRGLFPKVRPSSLLLHCRLLLAHLPGAGPRSLSLGMSVQGLGLRGLEGLAACSWRISRVPGFAV